MAFAVTPLETILKRDRLIVLASLLGLTIFLWIYLFSGAGMEMDLGTMNNMSGMKKMMTMKSVWNFGYFIIMLVMWWVMMVAMMIPSAAPMILLFTALNRKNANGDKRAIAAFVSAYVIAWGAFSLVATLCQWGFEHWGVLSLTSMKITKLWLGGGVLIAAGIWQLTPFKHSCLRHCRSPIHFFAQEWKAGAIGAFRMGWDHGLFCLGCCWILMALLFYGGVINMWWIAGLALYVLIEKAIPFGQWIGNFTGILLIVWGAVLFF